MKRILLTALILLFSVSTILGQYKYEVEMDYKLINLSKDILMEQAGTVEKQNNWGGMVTKYIKSTGLNYPIPYCGAGQYYCLYTATLDLKMDPKTQIPFNARKSASSVYWYNRGKAIGTNVKYEPEDNCIIVWRKRNNSSKGHVERIIEVGKKGWVTTIGFNTSNGKNGSQREGGGVFIRKRHIYNPFSTLLIKGLVKLKPINMPENKNRMYENPGGLDHLIYNK